MCAKRPEKWHSSVSAFSGLGIGVLAPTSTSASVPTSTSALSISKKISVTNHQFWSFFLRQKKTFFFNIQKKSGHQFGLFSCAKKNLFPSISKKKWSPKKIFFRQDPKKKMVTKKIFFRQYPKKMVTKKIFFFRKYPKKNVTKKKIHQNLFLAPTFTTPTLQPTLPQRQRLLSTGFGLFLAGNPLHGTLTIPVNMHFHTTAPSLRLQYRRLPL